MNLEEELEQLAVAQDLRIEEDLDRFGMRAMMPVGRVLDIAA